MNNLKWEQSETDEEDIENYGEGVERWELWDYTGDGQVVETLFVFGG
jgi:hypothetical protein